MPTQLAGQSLEIAGFFMDERNRSFQGNVIMRTISVCNLDFPRSAITDKTQ